MSLTTGIFADLSEMNSEVTLCRLCMKNNRNYYNIFASNIACQITVEDALHDLIGLRVALGDGLPVCICAVCFEKLLEFNDFKKICYESDAELRKISSRNYFKSIQGDGAAVVKVESSDEPKDCIQDATDGTSQLECSVQPTEIYIPVPNCQSSGDNVLFHVKEEKEDPLSEGDYQHTPTPSEIASDVFNPLATHGLPVVSTASQTGEVESECPGAIVPDLEWKLIEVKKEPSEEETGAAEFHVKEEKEDPLSEGDYQHTPTPSEIASDVFDPLATHGLPVVSTASQTEEVESECPGAIVPDLEWKLIEVKKEPSEEETGAAEQTSTGNGELNENWTTSHESMAEEVESGSCSNSLTKTSHSCAGTTLPLLCPTSTAGNKCHYYGCRSSRQRSPGVRFYKFPLTGNERRSKWIAHSGNPDLRDLSPKSLHKKNVCGKHFSSRDVLPSGRLVKGAIPLPYDQGHAVIAEQDEVEGSPTAPCAGSIIAYPSANALRNNRSAHSVSPQKLQRQNSQEMQTQ